MPLKKEALSNIYSQQRNCVTIQKQGVAAAFRLRDIMKSHIQEAQAKACGYQISSIIPNWGKKRHKSSMSELYAIGLQQNEKLGGLLNHG